MDQFLTVFLVLLYFTVVVAENLGRGFNDNIPWMDYYDGLDLSHKEKKPAMFLFHKSWCGACKALKPKFAVSKEIEEESKHFVMINVMDEEAPSDDEYQPDGGYIPRILFVDPEGYVRKEIYNRNGSEEYKYYYPDVEDIVDAMKRARQHIAKGPLKDPPQDEL